METMIFKLPPDLKQQLAAESERRGLSMAAYLRLMVFEYLKGEGRDEIYTVPVQ